MFWLSAMEPREAAPLMTTMRDCFPVPRGNKRWKQDIDQLCASMTERERAALEKKAEQIAKRIRRELNCLHIRPGGPACRSREHSAARSSNRRACCSVDSAECGECP